MQSDNSTPSIKAISNLPAVNPYLAILVGVLAVSFSSLFVKLSSAPAIVIATYRLLFTFLILAPYTAAVKREDLRALTLKDTLLAAVSGCFLAMHFVTWFLSLQYTSVASSVVLVTTQPIFVVIGSYLCFRESVPLKSMVGGVIALAGSFYIGATDFQLGSQALWGDFLALAAAILVSGYLLIGRRLRSRISLPAYTFVLYGASSLTLVLATWGAGLDFYPYSTRDWLLFLALAIVCTIMGHTVFNWALRYVQASVVAVSVLGEPIGAIVWALLFLSEAPSLRQLIGGAIILTGLLIFTLKSQEVS
ncbi:MAG TPA: DMT family transporter [Bacillota bacterium]|nr:DMT family transporter [Bacillota bacterium]